MNDLHLAVQFLLQIAIILLFWLNPKISLLNAGLLWLMCGAVLVAADLASSVDPRSGFPQKLK